MVGIDPSPTASGIARTDGSTETWKDPGLMDAGHATGSRLRELFDKAEELFRVEAPDLVLLEGYNPGLKKFGPDIQLGEVGGVFKLAAERAGLVVVVMTPSARSEFGCGVGNKSKKIVMAGWKQVTGLAFKDDNQCDASILREAGLWLLGSSDVAPSLPFTHQKALTKVKEGQRELIVEAKRRATSRT